MALPKTLRELADHGSLMGRLEKNGLEYVLGEEEINPRIQKQVLLTPFTSTYYCESITIAAEKGAKTTRIRLTPEEALKKIERCYKDLNILQEKFVLAIARTINENNR